MSGPPYVTWAPGGATSITYDVLATSSPREAVSRLRTLHRDKHPDRTKLVTAIVQMLHVPSDEHRAQFKELMDQYVPAGLHDVLLDIALDRKIYPVTSNYNLQVRLFYYLVFLLC